MTGFEYTNARVKGLKSFLISENDMKIALELKSVHDFAVWLENGPYKSFIDGKGITDIENALFKACVDTNTRILKLVPQKTLDFFNALVSVYEIESLKALISSKSGTKYTKTYLSFVSCRLSQLEKKLIEAESVEAMADILGKSEYGNLMKECLEEKKDISRELDRYYFENVWSAAQKLHGGDRSVAEKLLGPEIDAVNIMNILRSIGRDDYVPIPVFYNIRTSVVKECARADDVKNVVLLLSGTSYGSVLDEAAHKYDSDKSLFHFEQGLRRYIMKLYRKAMLDVLGIGVPLAYLKLKEREITTLRSIAFGLDNGIDKSRIEEMLA